MFQFNLCSIVSRQTVNVKCNCNIFIFKYRKLVKEFLMTKFDKMGRG